MAWHGMGCDGMGCDGMGWHVMAWECFAGFKSIHSLLTTRCFTGLQRAASPAIDRPTSGHGCGQSCQSCQRAATEPLPWLTRLTGLAALDWLTEPTQGRCAPEGACLPVKHSPALVQSELFIPELELTLTDDGKA